MKIRVVFTVDVSSGRWPVEEVKTKIAVAVTEAIPEEVPEAVIRWQSLGGSIPEVVQMAEMRGRSVRAQQERDANDYWA
ncbi:hypothetical protein AB0M72_03550 [Nocardiopsis dassonvillei]